ncbi:D-alanyl-D-alanine carboxypeptidase family protein [Pelosinus propionicus]|uniref:serine-type D-Ala-D-Ala carboxypeptidase n=1 Tax=Pelosinus propionicus DSM 13327 TaxID=1123291 RepID=A0A1I4KQX7_9FIRM|nr:D-alanyl-D-alanine carboxypeptidase family protein [Pelosinus propionicus]SFL81006.1 D-alanyl-D-alanine carboxypeptidase (penicillin-binding protein 5/6) [Pelosinus propionicus DSM 13327]
MFRCIHSKIVMILMCLLVLLSTCNPILQAADKKLSVTGLETIAQSAVLMDGNGTVLFEKDSHKRLPPASVTKSMTLLLAVEAVEQGRVNLTDQVTITENAWHQGGSQIWLEPGEQMTLHELMIAMAVVSANDAAVAVMEHIFGSQAAAVEAMNQRSTALGLKDTHFANVNGLPTPDHYMSAFDTALIAKEAVKHPFYMELCSIKEYWLRDGKNWLVNTNKLLWWYKGADGLKTGWTQEAQYCFAGTAKRDGLRLISVVFATPDPRSHLRESMKLLDWGFSNFAAMPIINSGAVVERVKVSKGMEKELQLVAAEDLTLLLSKGENKNLQKQVVADSAISAPIVQGQKCGELLVLRDGKEIGKVDLVAEKSVEKASLIKTLQNMFSNLFSIT